MSDLGVEDSWVMGTFSWKKSFFVFLGWCVRRRGFSHVSLQDFEGEQFELKPFFEFPGSWVFAPVPGGRAYGRSLF
ncbi:hypothetical protein AKJ41_02240 [candidate division MSBL1 archaeon SCGC-AAA259O05]|uniref:Uncharacterized protein n=1 Tax=candidate division MSBL1 archaeon SCGC-AAA259O05 TaxID=1698271 RepID=A0A133V492_9EURY|nr:hypothetical protein AKJ41_02240 [candidate division MSBL1 archaeon SCGC-AAA259O05]